MDCPARSPDLNPIENVWGILVRKVYRNNRQFETVAELKTAIEAAWMEVEPETIKNLIFSMPNRIFQLISKHGNQI